jgi:hypothetical protein
LNGVLARTDTIAFTDASNRTAKFTGDVVRVGVNYKFCSARLCPSKARATRAFLFIGAQYLPVATGFSLLWRRRRKGLCETSSPIRIRQICYPHQRRGTSHYGTAQRKCLLPYD